MVKSCVRVYYRPVGRTKTDGVLGKHAARVWYLEEEGTGGMKNVYIDELHNLSPLPSNTMPLGSERFIRRRVSSHCQPENHNGIPPTQIHVLGRTVSLYVMLVF
jgi:hypothetical protein